MSKIEKALRRARASGSLTVIAPGSAAGSVPSGTDSGSLAVVPQRDSGLAEVESRARSSAAIALMHEPHLLGRDALMQHRIIQRELSEDGSVRAFRELRTRILQKTGGRNGIIMVAGVGSGSGATFVSLNLSAAFAFDSGKTALLVDCNLRKPSLHRLLGDGQVAGLTDFLENPELDIGDVIHPVGIERLRVIPAGGNREIPGEYFTSMKMKRMLEVVRARYPERFVILDAPPMTESADTQILAELCDYVLLVMPYGRVTDTQIGECLKSVDSAKLLGVVFNNEPTVPTMPWTEMLRAPWTILRRWIQRLRTGSFRPS